MFRKITTFILFAVLLVTLCGCGNDYLDAYIYFEMENRPSTLDPQLVATREESVIVRSIFDTLLRYNEDGELVASAAESYTKNGLTYTFNIKEDAYWNDGTKLSAHDFEFAFKRALSPETKAPSAAALSAVTSAKAVDSKTFTVTLSQDDPDFLNTLTLPVTMPCNEAFFLSCEGKYGLDIDSVPACGSYYIRKWNTEDKFLIRLAKNLEFTGDFEARNMRVYYTCDKRDNITMLSENDTDFAFVSPEQAESASESGIALSALEDTTYLLFISPNINETVRSALMKSIKVDPSLYENSFSSHAEDRLFPDFLNINSDAFTALYPYDIETASTLYKDAVLSENNLSLDGISVRCYNEPTAIETAKAVTAHWQQKLGAFVNLEPSSSLDSLKAAYENNDYSILIMPMTANIAHTSTYISKFKTNATTPTALQKELGDKSLCYPLFSQSSYIAGTESLSNFDKIIHSGVPDVALAVKKEK